MIHFGSDYVEGAHEAILRALAANNARQMPGYGADEWCAAAARLIRARCAAPDAAVHFVAGGTMANALVIAAALRPHQAAVAPDTGHICTHETGAVQATGHSVLPLPHRQGKLTAQAVAEAARAHRDDDVREHTAQPKLVYISHPSEYGTLYTRAELGALREACRAWGLYLFVDGARLGYGLCAPQSDVDLPFLAECCDAFTIGGTKVGALFGEAIVLVNGALQQDFRYIEKQRGAMLAKGWLLGLQFCALFEDGLYEEGARHGIAMARRLADGLAALGVPLLLPAETNQLFPILPRGVLEPLRRRYLFETWQAHDEAHDVVRFCTAWSTPEAHVQALLDDLRQILAG